MYKMKKCSKCKIEKEFDEKFVGIHLKGRYDEYYNQNDDEYGSVSNLKEHKNFLRTSALELVKSVLSQEIERLEKNKRKLPYKPESPFQGESVDFHLKTYGHLPSRGCCEFDQYTEEQVENYNSALSSSIASLQEIIKIK